MGRADELRAELAVVELEEQLLAAKAAGEVDNDLKLRLRAARQEHRTLRAQRPPEPGEVRPEPVRAKTSVKRPGGGG